MEMQVVPSANNPEVELKREKKLCSFSPNSKKYFKKTEPTNVILAIDAPKMPKF
jgi:hypothetical protein